MATASFINTSAYHANGDITNDPKWFVFDVDMGDENQNAASAFQLIELPENGIILDADIACIQAPGAGTGTAALVISPVATPPASPAFHASNNVDIIADGSCDVLDEVLSTVINRDAFPVAGPALIGLDITEATAISGAAWEVRVRLNLMRRIRP